MPDVIVEAKEAVVDTLVDQAKEMGWKPLEEYEGEPNKWVDASIFVARAPLFEKIEQQNRENKETKRALLEMKALLSKSEDAAYKRALDSLKTQRKEALSEGDVLTADNIGDRIDELKQNPPKANVEASPPPEFQSWVARNAWYSDDEDMKDFADAKGVKFGATGVTGPDLLNKVEEAVKKAFPHKFKTGNPNREKAAGVETDSAQGKANLSSKAFKLSPEEDQVCNRMVRTGTMTREEYIKEIKKQRE